MLSNTEAWSSKVETNKQSFDLVALNISNVLKDSSKEIGSKANLQLQAVSRKERIGVEVIGYSKYSIFTLYRVKSNSCVSFLPSFLCPFFLRSFLSFSSSLPSYIP